MISKCKVCEEPIPVPKYGTSYQCAHCNKYALFYKDDEYLESESIQVDNYLLVFFPPHKEASVVERTEKHKIIHIFSMDELTHEDALRWVKKLKTYVIFQ